MSRNIQIHQTSLWTQSGLENRPASAKLSRPCGGLLPPICEHRQKASLDDDALNGMAQQSEHKWTITHMLHVWYIYLHLGDF